MEEEPKTREAESQTGEEMDAESVTEMEEDQKVVGEEGKKEAGNTTQLMNGDAIDKASQTVEIVSNEHRKDEDDPSSQQLPLHVDYEVGFSEEMNKKYRNSMEDGHVIQTSNFIGEHDGFFAVYDGHGGVKAMEVTRDSLHKSFEEIAQKDPEKPIEEVFSEAYRETDAKLTGDEVKFCGTTSVTVYIRRREEEDGNINVHLYSANAGDARAVLGRGGKAIRLTFDHKATDPDEVKRIVDNKGFVVYNRVNSILAITRALGDYVMKKWIISEPYQTNTQLTVDDTHLIVACDGLWDVCEDQEAIDIVLDCSKEGGSMQAAADKLLEYAMDNNTTDNLSIMVVKLK